MVGRVVAMPVSVGTNRNCDAKGECIQVNWEPKCTLEKSLPRVVRCYRDWRARADAFRSGDFRGSYQTQYGIR
jgi:hypothetical protein